MREHIKKIIIEFKETLSDTELNILYTAYKGSI